MSRSLRHVGIEKRATLLLVALTACTGSPAIDPSEDTASVRQNLSAYSFRVSGVQDVWQHNAMQSETSVAHWRSEEGHRYVFAYNDHTALEELGLIDYPEPNTRVVFRGASTLGFTSTMNPVWTVDPSDVANWTYGKAFLPPGDWAVQWGDPATTWLKGTSVVYLAGAAVPESKYPPDGIVDSPSHLGMVEALGGACIYISQDHGQSFQFDQCVYEGQGAGQHFYDGGSLASVVSWYSVAYGAWLDAGPYFPTIPYDARAAIWRWSPVFLASGAEKLPDPFPGLGAVGVHPIVRTYGDDYLNHFAFVVAPIVEDLFINRWSPLTETWASPVLVANLGLGVNSIPTASRGPYRAGRNFSYDISPSGEIRILFTRQHSNGSFYIAGARCDLNLNCMEIANWGTHPANWPPGGWNWPTGSWSFRPMVAATSGRWGPPVWAASFLSTPGPAEQTNEINFWGVSFSEQGFWLAPTLASPVATTEACPSTLSAYFSDYDDLVVHEEDPAGENPGSFLASHPDSWGQCYEQAGWKSRHQHVSGFVFDPGDPP